MNNKNLYNMPLQYWNTLPVKIALVKCDETLSYWRKISPNKIITVEIWTDKVYIYRKIKIKKRNSKWKNKYSESAGFQPPLQMHWLVFIIKFDTITGLNMKYFMYSEAHSGPCQIFEVEFLCENSKRWKKCWLWIK